MPDSGYEKECILLICIPFTGTKAETQQAGLDNASNFLPN